MFDHFGLNRLTNVKTDAALLRPSDIVNGAADPALAWTELGWRAQYDVHHVIREMCEHGAGQHANAGN